jgi:ELWxxDGT repeat protein
MRQLTLAVLVTLVAPLALRAQSPYLVKDVNATTAATPASSAPNTFFRFGSRVFFAAGVQGSGIELWATDGSDAGTVQVADINAGTGSSTPSHFGVLNGKLIFNASDGRTGNELWTSDGTAAGTRLLADIRSGSASSFPNERIVVGDKMIFAADDGVDGNELWITDGTPSGTRFFKDLAPGPAPSDPRSFVLFHNIIYFVADNGLWKSDGTEAGTVLVKGGVPAFGLVLAGSQLFFGGFTDAAANEVWVSDGTEAGTRMITDINPGPANSIFYLSGFTVFGDRILFAANEPQHGGELWISDGSAAGTHVLRDIRPGADSGSPGQLAVTDRGVAFFTARTDNTGEELWKTDGTENGTVLVRDIVPGPSSSGISGIVAVGDKVYFIASNASGFASTLWVSDGTESGTRQVVARDQLAALESSGLTIIDGVIYFAGANRLNGYEPWKSDGTDAGTTMIRNLARDVAPSSNPFNLIAAGDWVYFAAWDGSGPVSNNGGQPSMWRSDGTADGTLKIANFFGDNFRTVGHSLYFGRSSSGWTSNGTPEGTSTLAFPNSVLKGPSFAFANGDTFFFFGSDGTNDGLFAVKQSPNAVPEALGVGGSIFINQAGRTLFAGNGVWTSDGTRAGTYSIVPATEERVTELTSMGGNIYYVTQSTNGPGKLWRNDGTFESNVLLKSLPAAPVVLTAAERHLFFLSGGQLWVSDGTEAGTQVLTAGTTFLSTFAVTGGRAIFAETDAANGLEPWVSDGTVAGTHLLRDLYPGTFGSFPSELTSVRASVYFTAADNLSGSEIWMTDGTSEGTTLAADVVPGSSGSFPHQYVEAGDRLFFTATTAETGNELWALPLPTSTRLNVNDVRIAEGDSGTSTGRFTVTLSAPSTKAVTVDYATSDGTASSSSDYDAASGTLTFAAGETSKTIDVRIHGDVAAESNETFFLTLSHASGATLQKDLGVAIIDDDDQIADLGLLLDFSNFSSLNVFVNAANNGPRTATNIHVTHTATPADGSSQCAATCAPPSVLASGANAKVFGYNWPGSQQYLTVAATIHERDPQPANNAVGWVTSVNLAMDALFLNPGSQANVWFTAFNTSSVSITSSNPSVISVPSTMTVTAGQIATFIAHGGSLGTATIRIFTPTATAGTLTVDVVAPGTTPRWPGAILAFATNGGVSFDSPLGFAVMNDATAPYTGAKPTGTVTVTANGHELGRITLKADVSRQDVTNYLPDLGDNAIRFDYPGDANFLAMAVTSNVRVSTGRATVLGGASRIGNVARVHVRVTGSPSGAPSGTITVSEPGVIAAKTITLSAGAPGESQADIDLPNISAGSHTFLVAYSGDPRYGSSAQSVRMIEARVRSVKH